MSGFPPPNPGLCRHLSELLRMAQEGQLQGAAIAACMADGSSDRRLNVAPSQGYAVLIAMQLLSHELASEVLRCERAAIAAAEEAARRVQTVEAPETVQ